MKAPTRRRGRTVADATPPRKQAEITPAIPPAQQTVERLQHVLSEIDSLPLPTGGLGCQFLDALELVDKIREKVRVRARELLLKAPGAIPCWQASETSQRALSKNTAGIFEALSRADDSLTRERFLESCSTNLTMIRRLFAERNPQWNPDQVERELSLTLGGLIHYETVVRLTRSKERHHIGIEGQAGVFELEKH